MPVTLNIEEKIYNSLITILAAAMVTTPTPGVLSYVKVLKQGNADDSMNGQKPFIAVSPTSVPEKWAASQNKKELNLTIEIRGVMDVPSVSQIISTATTKGILRLDADIKNVIENDLTLAGEVLSLNVETKEIANIGGNTYGTAIILTTQRRFIKGAR